MVHISVRVRATRRVGEGGREEKNAGLRRAGREEERNGRWDAVCQAS